MPERYRSRDARCLANGALVRSARLPVLECHFPDRSRPEIRALLHSRPASASRSWPPLELKPKHRGIGADFGRRPPTALSKKCKENGNEGVVNKSLRVEVIATRSGQASTCYDMLNQPFIAHAAARALPLRAFTMRTGPESAGVFSTGRLAAAKGGPR